MHRSEWILGVMKTRVKRTMSDSRAVSESERHGNMLAQEWSVVGYLRVTGGHRRISPLVVTCLMSLTDTVVSGPHPAPQLCYDQGCSGAGTRGDGVPHFFRQGGRVPHSPTFLDCNSCKS